MRRPFFASPSACFSSCAAFKSLSRSRPVCRSSANACARGRPAASQMRSPGGKYLPLNALLVPRPRHQPLAVLALDRDVAAVGPSERDVGGRRIAGQTGRQRLLEREVQVARSGDAERVDERRRIAAAPILEDVHDERRRRAQRVDSRAAARTRRELGASAHVIERGAGERNAQVVGEVANAAARVVTHAVRIGPAALGAQ